MVAAIVTLFSGLTVTLCYIKQEKPKNEEPKNEQPKKEEMEMERVESKSNPNGEGDDAK